MKNIKVGNWKIFEIITFVFIIVFVITNAIIKQDNPIALISAICGITYTIIAGKGHPVCYIFGLCGSGLYSYLAYQNSLWGNLALYSCYYIPMQILGYIRWNKNLKSDSKEIIKINLPKKELGQVLLFSLCGVIALSFFLYKLEDAHPILDSITAVFSIAGMYLTVRRAIEQWLFWMVVNGLSFVMWLMVAASGVKVYSTVIMWGVYLILAFYFYFMWRKEIKETCFE